VEGVRRRLQRLAAAASRRRRIDLEEKSFPPGKNASQLSYKESRELEALPKEIEALEAEQRVLQARMGEPDYYRRPPEALRAEQARNGEIETLLMEKLERWQALESRNSGSG